MKKSILLIFVILLTACSPAATAAPATSLPAQTEPPAAIPVPAETLPTAPAEAPAPKPVATSVPTSGPEPTKNGEELYRQEANRILFELAEIYSSYADLIGELAFDPQKLFDTDFNARLMTAVETYQAKAQELVDLENAPAKYNEVEKLINDFGIQVQNMVEQYRIGIESKKGSTMITAGEHMYNATLLFGQIQALLAQ